MGNVTYHPPRLEDIAELALTMRQADADEVTALEPRPLYDIVSDAVRRSITPGSAWGYDGELMCIFGAVPFALLGDEAAPWLLGTNALFNYPLELTKGTQRYLTHVRQQYPRLSNFVDQRNSSSIAWLKAIGFTIDEAQPMGHLGLPFHRFHIGY